MIWIMKYTIKLKVLQFIIFVNNFDENLGTTYNGIFKDLTSSSPKYKGSDNVRSFSGPGTVVEELLEQMVCCNKLTIA